MFVVGWPAPATLLQLLIVGGSALLVVRWLDPGPALDTQVEAATGTISGREFLGRIVVLLWQASIWVPWVARTHDIRRVTATGAVAVAVLLGIVGLLLS